MWSLTLLVAACATTALSHEQDIEYHPSANIQNVFPKNGNEGELEGEFWRIGAQRSLRDRLARPVNERVAKNVIMFLGDGMSVTTLAAARTLLGQRQGDTGEEANLSFETFPAVGLAKTYCVDQQIADSACSATAYLCGVKANYGTIGVDARVRRSDCAASTDDSTHVSSIAAWALDAGRDAGIVTNTRITHASPAGAYAHVANRTWEDDNHVRLSSVDPERCPDIAQQLIHHYPGNEFKVILGGGRLNFISSNTASGPSGRRVDGRNLIEEWQSDKQNRGVSHEYVTNLQELRNVDTEDTDYLLGLFSDGHMPYHAESNEATDPSLEELTEAAIKMLSKNEKGYFLFVEGGRIDHGHHANYVNLALDETIEFSKAVQRARNLTSEEDTLIVVTSDHSHVMAFNGYAPRGHDVLGPSNSVDRDAVPYMTLSYTNGPGFRAHVDGNRPDVTQESNFDATRWRSHVDVPLSSETHGGEDVAVFALGPQQHMFTGLYEQNEIPHLMAYAACLGDGAQARACSAASTLQKSFIVLMASLIYLFIYRNV